MCSPKKGEVPLKARGNWRIGRLAAAYCLALNSYDLLIVSSDSDSVF